MLKTRDMIVVNTKDAEGKDKGFKSQTYERVWLEYGANDPVETINKTNKGKTIGEVTRPKNDVTVHQSDDLMTEAHDLYVAEFDPKGEDDNKVWRKMLEDMSYGRNLRVTAPTRQTLAPTKPIDQDKAILDAAKKQVAGGLYDTIEEAVNVMRERAKKRAAAAAEKAKLETVATTV